MPVIAGKSACENEQAGRACRTREYTAGSGYRANCDENEIENDYIERISGDGFDKRLR
jgi:hypothetical protein